MTALDENDLTVQEICEVARLVTGHDHEVRDGRAFTASGFFQPSFTNGAHYRSQALAIVEWLIAKIWKDYVDYNDLGEYWLFAKIGPIGLAVKDKDIHALSRMVLEIGENHDR
jgi:hypothetical protein